MGKLDKLIPVLYESLDVVSRELVGMIPASTYDGQASASALGQKVHIPITKADNSLEDIVPGSSKPTGTGDDFEGVDIVMTNFKRSKPIVWSGEDQLAVGSKTRNIIRDQYTQRMRTLVNRMEEDLALEALASGLKMGNIVGTEGTNPFVTDTNALTKALKKLKDAGITAESGELNAVLNTTSGMNLRNIKQLQSFADAGDNGDLLRRGVIGNLFGFNIRESAGFKAYSASGATGYLVNGGAAKGATDIDIDTGSGNIARGTIVTFGSDTTKYVVAEDYTAGDETLKIVSGLVASVADNVAVTVGSAYEGNACFPRSSIVLATRVPAVPEGGDEALDRTVITDPVSGLSFEVALWGGAYQNTVTIAAVWGCKDIKPEHAVALLG